MGDGLVYVWRDGQVRAGPMTADEAFTWLLQHQGNSIHHATTYEGWKVEAGHPTVVAEAKAKAGGPCAHCHRHISKGAATVKLAPACCPQHHRATTSENGPGRWVCIVCSAAIDPRQPPQQQLQL